MEFLSQKYLFAVGQKSFGDPQTFSTLVPVATLNGNPIPDPQENFPNRGRLWWMVRGEARVTYAPPGCLLVAGIEPAIQQTSEANKDRYQALQPALPRPSEFIEILTPPGQLKDPNALLDGYRMRCDHEPTRFVLVRLGGELYGPLKIELDGPENERLLDPDVGFTKPGGAHSIYRISASLLTGEQAVLRHSVYVWPSNQILSENEGRRVSYELLTGDQLEKLKETAEEVELVGTEDALRQVTKAMLTKKQRSAFIREFQDLLKQADVSDAVLDRAHAILRQQQDHEQTTGRFFAALLDDEEFKVRLDSEIGHEVQRRITRRAAEIDATAQQQVSALIQKREDLDAEYGADKERFQQVAEQRRRDLESDLERRRAESKKEIDEQFEELGQLETEIRNKLVSVTQRYETGRDDLVKDYLALEPLLRRLGVGDRGESGKIVDTVSPSGGNRVVVLDLSAPASRGATEPNVKEDDFFERFAAHVAASGFVFDRNDLLAFHLSAKHDSPVILGGVSGTGKSSLPVLYMEALSGEEHPSAFLPVDVNPSWTSPADLLGYTDALEHCFVPSASGMFDAIIRAGYAYGEIGSQATIHAVCLEEMNLAQPEYYLADIIQAISRPPVNRTIGVFDPGAVRADDPYAAYARLSLPPNLLLFGTLNFDETTRPLSPRLLDRCNFIELTSEDALAPLARKAATGMHVSEGPSVRLADMHLWTRKTDSSPLMVKVLTAMQPDLQVLGCPVTPRRHSAIQQFVANFPASLCSEQEAIDMQLRQRIVPQMNHLHRPGAVDAVRRISRTLSDLCAVPRTTDALDRLVRNESSVGDTFAYDD